MPKTLHLELPDTLYERMVKKKTRDGYKASDAESWKQWFSTLCKDTLLYPTVEKQAASAEGLLPMWMRSFSRNLPDMWSGKDLRELVDASVGKRSIVVGRGPTMYRKNLLKQLADSDPSRFNIISTDGALIDLLKAGVTPQYVVTVDGSDVCYKWYANYLVRKSGGETKALLCSQTGRKVVEQVRDIAGLGIYWFHPATDVISNPNSLTRALLYMTVSEKHPNGLLAIYCGGNVGTTSLMITMNILKSQDIALIGFDFSYPKDMPLKETYYYERAVEYSGVVETGAMYEEYYHPIFGTWSHTDPVFRSYRDSLYEQLEHLPSTVKITNCSEGGILTHRNLPCKEFKQWLQ